MQCIYKSIKKKCTIRLLTSDLLLGERDPERDSINSLGRLEAEAAAVTARVRLEGKARHAVKGGPVYRLERRVGVVR